MKTTILALMLSLSSIAFASEHVHPLTVIETSRCASGFAAKGEGYQYYYCVNNLTGHEIGAGYYQACINFRGRKGNAVIDLLNASPAQYRVALLCN